MLMEVPFPAVLLPCLIIRRHVPRSLPDRDKKSYFSCPVGKGNPDIPSVLRRASCGARPDYPGVAPTDKFRSRQFLCPSDFRTSLWFAPMRSVVVRNSARTQLAPIVD